MAPTDRKIRNWIKGNVSTSRWKRFVDVDIAVIRKMCEWYAKQAVEQAVKAERTRLIDRLKRLEFHAVQDPVCRFSPEHEIETISPGQKAIRHCIELLEADNG